jgi:hypothetical protein
MVALYCNMHNNTKDPRNVGKCWMYTIFFCKREFTIIVYMLKIIHLFHIYSWFLREAEIKLWWNGEEERRQRSRRGRN